MESVTVLFVALCFAGISVQAADLKVSVYYESLCPDSIKFIKDQFNPAYSTVLKDKINVDFVPFGKATAIKSNGTWSFTCQHKEPECYGNKVQSCAIDIASYNTSIEFVVCAMKSGDASDDELLKQCAEDNQIKWDDIDNCLKSGKGDELLAKYGDRTNAVTPKITFIPTIVFNDVYTDKLQELALKDFLTVSEVLLEKPDCSKCSSSRMALSIAVLLLPLISMLKLR
ncbi:GILT-like protein 1 [Diabrotica virgifera virgifera]|uniref:GILT-like protein 1 n=1 Tax=Diabrotica virgifera virgifera TaxID=50390 RepID=A0A6P7FW08_DIAVI|nr:GILT-like protein 1 [Diabrotica virgifera virgifera]